MVRRCGLVLSSLVVALVAVFALAGSAVAQQPQYPVQESNLQTDKTSVRPGEALDVAGDGFEPGAIVTVTFDGVVLGTTRARADGTFAMTITIPASATAGNSTLAATGAAVDGGTRGLTSTINVRGASLGAQAALPRTGTGLTVPLTVSAALLIGAGALTVVASRRRPA